MDQNQLNQLRQAMEAVKTGQNIQQATEMIQNGYTQPGFCLSMMMIANESDTHIDIRQQAMTNFGQAVKKHWNPKGDITPICENDKQTVKGSLVDALINVIKVRKLARVYEGILYDLIALEFPHRWPNLMTDVNNRLVNSQNQDEIYGCLLIIQQAYSVNEYFLGEERQLFDNIVSQTYPGLTKISVILSQNYGPGVADMVKIILKCYDSATNLTMTPLLADNDQINNWMCFVKIILDYNLPQDLTQLSNSQTANDEKKAHVLWKNKKWCARIALRFLQKYCQPAKFAHVQHLTHIPQFFLKSYSVSFLESLVQLLFKNQTEFVSPQVIHFGLKYVYYSLKYTNTKQMIVPHLDKIMFDVCLPLCAHNSYDEELWNDNPDEYLRKEEDYGTNTHQNKNCAMELLEKIAEIQDQEGKLHLYKLVNFSVQCLESGNDPRSNTGISVAFREGLLWIFGRLKKMITEAEGLNNLLEVVLGKYIMPEFQSTQGLLRARACWVFGRYSQVEFQNTQNLQTAVTGICQCLQDKFLPVRIRAAVSLDGLVQQDQAIQILKPHLETVFKLFIQIMQESDHEGLADSLDTVVKAFADELTPFAYGLIMHLTQSFQKFVNKNQDPNNENAGQEDDEDSGNQRGAVSCLDAISNILDADLKKDLYPAMEPVVMNCVDFCLLDKNMSFMEEGLGLLNLLLFNQDQVSDKIAFYFPFFIYSILGSPPNATVNNMPGMTQIQNMIITQLPRKGYLNDYLENLMSPLKNYIAKGKIDFLNKVDFYGNKMIDILKLLVQDTLNTFNPNAVDPETNEKLQPLSNDMAMLTTLYIALVEHNAGQIDHLLGDILSQALNFVLNESYDKFLRVVNCELVSVCLYFNTQFTFQYLQGKNLVTQFYQSWIQLLPSFKHDYDKGRALVGLSAIMKLEQNQIPQELVGSLQTLIQQMVKLTTEILEVREEDDSDMESDDDFADEDGKNVEQSKENDKEFFHRTISKLQKLTEQEQSGQLNDDDDEDEDYNLEEVIGQNFRYETAFDKQCEILIFEKILQGLQQNNQAFYNHMTQSLSSEEQVTLSNNFKKANEQMVEWQKMQQPQQQQQSQNSSQMSNNSAAN